MDLEREIYPRRNLQKRQYESKMQGQGRNLLLNRLHINLFYISSVLVHFIFHKNLPLDSELILLNPVHNLIYILRPILILSCPTHFICINLINFVIYDKG
jgi:hypothetical protein